MKIIGYVATFKFKSWTYFKICLQWNKFNHSLIKRILSDLPSDFKLLGTIYQFIDPFTFLDFMFYRKLSIEWHSSRLFITLILWSSFSSHFTSVKRHFWLLTIISWQWIMPSESITPLLVEFFILLNKLYFSKDLII